MLALEKGGESRANATTDREMGMEGGHERTSIGALNNDGLVVRCHIGAAGAEALEQGNQCQSPTITGERQAVQRGQQHYHAQCGAGARSHSAVSRPLNCIPHSAPTRATRTTRPMTAELIPVRCCSVGRLVAHAA